MPPRIAGMPDLRLILVRLLAVCSVGAAATIAIVSLRQTDPFAFWPPVALFSLIALTCWSYLRHRRK